MYFKQYLMKKIILLFAAAFGMIAAERTFGQELELLAQEVYYSEGKHLLSSPEDRSSTLILQAYGYIPIQEESPVGAWAFYFSQPLVYNYHELIAGLATDIEIRDNTFQIGIGAGGESWDGDNGFRAGGFIYWERGEKWSGEYYAEAGQVAEFWYQSHLTYQVTNRFAFGMYSQTEPGVGIRAMFTPWPESKAPVTLWANAGHKGGSIVLQMDFGGD